MELMIRLSGLIYRWLLLLYPAELRCRFGVDMVEVFEDLISDAVVERGVLGIVWLWSTVFWEFVSVGLPSPLTTSAVIAATLSFTVSSVIAWVFFRAVG
jgi:hypothetical protein